MKALKLTIAIVTFPIWIIALLIACGFVVILGLRNVARAYAYGDDY